MPGLKPASLSRHSAAPRFASLLALGVSFLVSPAFAQEAEPVLPQTPYNYAGVALPNHFLNSSGPGPGFAAAVDSDNTPASNPTTDHGATLGRVLFYEKKLSANGTVSCGSCHIQKNGFSDPDRFSSGFEGGLTPRHSMGLANSRFYERGRFFWDERAATLEAQTLVPIQDHVEMGLTLAELVAVVDAQPYYDALFVNAFGDATVTSDRISKALAQFVRSMVSINSKYDQARSAVNRPTLPFPGFTASENLGKDIFMNVPNRARPFDCINCHQTEAFVAAIPTNNGLDAVSSDLGVGAITGLRGDNAKFKVPSLRNIAARPPFMHDGRFAALEQVVEHYNSGIQSHPSLHNALEDETGAPRRLGLTASEKSALVDFLKTLTDQYFLSDVKFSDPFDPDNLNGSRGTPPPPSDTWTQYYNLANYYYGVYAAAGYYSYAAAYYFYYNGFGNYAYNAAYGKWHEANYAYDAGLGLYYYNLYAAYGDFASASYYYNYFIGLALYAYYSGYGNWKLAGYNLYYYWALAYYSYYSGLGDYASAAFWYSHFISMANAS